MNSVLVHFLQILSIIQFVPHGDQVLDWSKQKKSVHLPADTLLYLFPIFNFHEKQPLDLRFES